MNDMMALFGRDAESRYAERQEGLNLQQPRVLSQATDEIGIMRVGSRSLSSEARDRGGRQQEQKRPGRSEDSVYGRRW